MKNLSSSKPIKAIEMLFGLVGIVMILVETYAVMARNILQISTPWSDELLKLLFVWSIFVCSALAFLNDELISLTLFEDDAKEKGKMALYGIFKIIQYVATLIISGLLVYQIWTIVNTQLSTGEATTVLKYPLWVMNSGILVGMVLTVVFGIIKLVDCLKYFKKTPSED